jgi:hypothetical protein
MKIADKLLPIVLATQCLSVQAAPSPFMNARAFAMGGTGVASAHPGAAGFYNPALLSVDQQSKNDAFSLFLPSVNARVSYDGDLQNKLDNYQNSYNGRGILGHLQDLISTYNTSVQNNNYSNASSQLQNIIDTTKQMEAALTDLNKTSAGADIGLGTSFALPGKRVGYGVFINTSIKATATVRYRDSALLNSYIQTAEQLKQVANSNGTPSNIQEIIQNGGAINSGAKQLQSDAVIYGAAFTEVGIPLAHEFMIGGHNYAIGITPKIIRADMFNYRVDPNNYNQSNFKGSDYKTTKTALNLDVGIAREFGKDKAWTAALSVRNLIPKTYEFKKVILNPNDPVQDAPKMKLAPLVTAGISHTNSWHTIAVDLDLTKNKHFGMTDDEQFLSVGGEFNAFDMLQLRAGFRYNIASNKDTPPALREKSAVTAGIGLDLFSFNLALSGYAGNKQKGGALELGIVF